MEQADVRRKQAKQKKQWSEDKKLWKQWIHDCMKHQLDQNAPRIHQLLLSVLTDQDVKKMLTLQMWTDTKPSRSANRIAAVTMTRNDDSDDIDKPDPASLKKNQRSKSKSVGGIDDDDDDDDDIDEEDQEAKGTPRGNKKGQRNRSNSTGGGGGNSSATKKKAHPRSKEAMAAQSSSEHLSSSTATAAAGNDNDDVSMCRSYFFTGNCPLVKKKHSCRYVHPHPSTDSNRTLHEALLLPTTTATTTTTRRRTVDPAVQLPQSARAEMIAAERAATITTTVAAAAAAASPDTTTTTAAAVDPIVGAMNMVYYVEVPISFDVSVNKDNPFCLLPSEQVTSVFIDQSLIFGNIVYMALNGILFFDRYQDGKLFGSEEFLPAIFGEAVENVVLCQRERYSTNPDDVALLVHLPVISLEHICSYLLDESAMAMAQVCRAWYNEIGRCHAPMWKLLLNRRDWPYDDCTNVENDQCSYREQFHQHYVVLRDIQALNKVFNAFAAPTRNSHTNNVSIPAVALHDFSSRRNSPTGACVGIETWSPRLVLLAYTEDCTLRLFESSHKISAGGDYTNDKHCRELICYRINPYRKTKKKTCYVSRFVLDEKFIVALCTIDEHPHCAVKEILVTITRDNYLLGESDVVDHDESSSSNPLQVFPMTDAILQYMQHHDQAVRPQFLDDLDETLLSRFSTCTSSISSCGPGRLLASTHMFLKQSDNRELDDMEFLDAKLFLISTTTREILWSNSCYPVYDEIPVRNFTVDNIVGKNYAHRYLHKEIGESRAKALCDFAVVSGGRKSTIMVGEMDSSGTVCSFDVLPPATSPWSMEEVRSGQMRFSKFSKRNVVITPNGIVTTDVWIRYSGAAADVFSAWVSNCTVVTFYPTTCYPSIRKRSDSNMISEISSLKITENLIAHHVSCVRRDYLVVMCEELHDQPSIPWMNGLAVSVVIHIPSRREVGRFNWRFEGHHFDREMLFLPWLASNGQGTLGMELMHMGVIITGDDVRHQIHDGNNDDISTDPQQLELSAKKKKKKAVRSKKDGLRTHNGDRSY